MEKQILIFKRKNARVQAVLCKSSLKQLLWMVGNYFDVHMTEKMEKGIWTVYENIFLLDEEYDFENICEKTPDGPNSKLLINSKNKIIVIYQDDGDNLFYLFRMIRSLLRWDIYDNTVLFLHGGVVDIEGEGVAFLGNKRSGKTSTILSMIMNQDANYVTNDDLMISFEKDIVAYGWPRSLSIRKDTLDILNIHKKERMGNEIHPSNVFLRKNSIESEHEYYLPLEVCQLGKGHIVQETKLKYIIFPQFVQNNIKKAYLEEIDVDEARKKIQENVRINPEKYFLMLKSFFDIPDSEYINNKIEVLCKNVKFYKLYQTFDALELGAQQVKKLFNII